MSRLTNPITPTDFFITEIRLSYFHNFFIIFCGSIKDQIVWVTTRNTYPFPYSYAHTEPTRIHIYVCMYHNVHILILSDMYIHVHTCVHVHTNVVFICTYVYRYIYVCTHMYTLTHILFFCMYIQVNTAGHILDDQQIHFVWYKRDFESRELVLSDARVNCF